MVNVKQNPFSFYDFLGYFTPGAILLFGWVLIKAHLDSSIKLEDAISNAGLDKAEMYVPFILISYVIGHLLSYISSVTIERYSIWAYDYPSRFILALPCNAFWDVKAKREYFVRGFVCVLLFPIPILDFILGKGLYLRNLFAKGLDNELASIVKNKVKALIKEKGQVEKPDEYDLKKDHDFFRYVYHYAVENSNNHLPKMQNYVALYGFLRTLSLIFIIGTWSALVHFVINVYRLMSGIEGSDIPIFFWTLLAFMLLTYISYMGFMKFYRRFSLEALMAVSVTFMSESNKTPQPTPERGAELSPL